MRKRVAVFGCKRTSEFIIDALRERVPVDVLITISPELAARNDVADYVDLAPFAAARGINCHSVENYGLKSAKDGDAIKAMKIDLAFVIGWQRLVPPQILAGFSVGAFGMHGSADDLPRGRGRSPMNWSLIEGRERFHTNLFKYDAGVDSGAVLDNFTFTIRPQDTAETLHFKNTLAMKRLVLKNLDALLNDAFALKPQKNLPPSFYPKRNPEDSIIDWCSGIEELERFIRAVAPPFNGAFSFIDGKKVIIERAAIFETDSVDFGQQNLQPGTVVEVFPKGKWLVRCRGGLLIVHDFLTEACIAPGVRCVSPNTAIRTFPRNAEGHFDIEANNSNS